MIRGLVRVASKARPVRFSSRSASAPKSIADIQTEEWGLFPREKEGNIYDHNWSLVEDGVVPVNNAYRNARVPILTNDMKAKVVDGKIESSGPKYFGEFRVSEAGDDMTHETFSEIFAAQQQVMSCDGDLYFEDAILGSHAGARNGVRVTSSVPAVALIFRSLLIPSPPVEVNHRARFKGWNFDPRWKNNMPVWNGASYDLPEEMPKVPQLGQRPIVAFVGDKHNIAAVQFVENNSEIVGANVVVGTQVPVRGIVHAVGHAACVLLNTQLPASVTLPSTALAKGRDTAILLGGGDEVVEAAAKAGLLYGAYHNTVSAEGVSAVWGGYISSDVASARVSQLGSTTAPVVAVDGKVAVHNYPNNLANPAKHFVFYEKGAAKGKLSADEALKRLVTLSEESKTEALKAILQGAHVSVIGSPADIASIF